MASEWLASVSGNLSSNVITNRRSSHTNPGIPVRMIGEPRQCFRSEAFHCYLWQQFTELLAVVANPTVCQDDVGIQNLPGHRIYSTRPNRCANVIVQPTDEVVVHIFRVFVHVSTGRGVLVVHFDRFGDPDVFECLIPRQDTFPHPAAVTNRCGVFDVEHNRGLRWTQLQFCIRLFE